MKDGCRRQLDKHMHVGIQTVFYHEKTQRECECFSQVYISTKFIPCGSYSVELQGILQQTRADGTQLLNMHVGKPILRQVNNNNWWLSGVPRSKISESQQKRVNDASVDRRDPQVIERGLSNFAI